MMQRWLPISANEVHTIEDVLKLRGSDFISLEHPEDEAETEFLA